jgi:glycosyltransferase involved in cell wall biosynthesis
MQKIVIFTHAISRGGAEKQGMLLAKALKNDYNCLIVTWYGELNEERQIKYIKENNLQVIPLTGSFLVKILSFCKILKKYHVEVIFSYLTINNVISAVCGKMMGVTHIIGGMRSSRMSEEKLKINRLLHNYVFSYTVINSQSGYDYFSGRGFKEDKFKIIHNCIELDFVEKKPKSLNNNDKFNVLTISRFQSEKDLFTAIKGVAIFIQNNKDAAIHYHLIGIGEQEAYLRKFVSNLNLNEYISIIVNPDNLELFLHEADVYLSTSLYEGLSNSIMEAMSYSLPVIATKVGDNKILVENELNGYLVDTQSPEKISEYLLILHGNPLLRHEFGRRSYEKISNFSMDSFRVKYTNLISKLIS